MGLVMDYLLSLNRNIFWKNSVPFCTTVSEICRCSMARSTKDVQVAWHGPAYCLLCMHCLCHDGVSRRNET